MSNLIRLAPSRTEASYYRTASGNEIDLVLDLPGNQRWVVEITRSSTPSVTKGFHSALADLEPDAAFVVYLSDDR